MTLLDRVRAAWSSFEGVDQRAPKVKPPAEFGHAGAFTGGNDAYTKTRKGTRILRRFAERNAWVRIAINRRKHELSRAEWTLVRTDDKNAKPDPKVVAQVQELFKFVNDTRASFPWLLSCLIEDILIFDAGCCEKERTAGGKVVALWSVPGDEIMPTFGWDGSKPREPRYTQYRDGREIGQYLNDELVYMMANPASHRVTGLSPVEFLIQTIEADLYGESFEYRLMKETAPAGILYLGGGVPAEKVDAFRMQWEKDIAGTRDVAIIGGGAYDPETGVTGTPPLFIPFTRTSQEDQRREYMKWLATKVAASFEMDLMAFNLSETVHRSIGENLQAKTDSGLLGLAAVLESYTTREIIWELDPSHTHAFRFQGLIPKNHLTDAQVDEIYNRIGVYTPNKILSRMGDPPVPWGDVPFPAASAVTTDPADPYDAAAQQARQDEKDAADAANAAKAAKAASKSSETSA